MVNLYSLKEKFRITKNEWIFVLVMTLLAIIFTNKFAIQFLNKLNPFWGFVVYYIIIYSALTILGYFGLVAFGVEIKNPLQIIGSGLILFSFFAIFNWENLLTQFYATGSTAGVAPIFLGSEDGILVFSLSKLIDIQKHTTLLWIAFVSSISIISLIGVSLAKLEKVSFK